MKKLSRLVPVALLAFLVAPGIAEDKRAPASEEQLQVGTAVGKRLPHFTANLVDLAGEQPATTAFDSHKLSKPTAFVFMSKSCPFCTMYKKRLAAMSKTYAAKGLDIVMVYPTRRTPAETKMRYHKDCGFTGPMINDAQAAIARDLKIKKTPEVVLVSKKGEIMFRGGIDDNPRDATKVKKPNLKNACDDVLAGRKPRVTTSPLYG